MNTAFEIAKQTILQSQTGISITTNNIANSKVDGYTRQQANFVTAMSVSKGNHLVGTGANISSIDRIRLGYYDLQYRENIGVYSNASAMATALKQIETYFGTVDGETGIKSTMEDMFNSLEELSKNPENIGIKQIVKDSAVAMAKAFNQIATDLKNTQTQYANYTATKINEINSLLQDLQSVNLEIGRITAMGQTANDLFDKRDILIDKLASFMDISITHTDNNKINITSNGQVLIQDAYTNTLKMEVNPDNTISVTYDNGKEFNSKTGELSALIEVANESIPKYLEQVDILARDFIDSFNNIHMNGKSADGTTGLKFFEGNSALDMRVSDVIIADPSKIATSTDGTSGNNDIVMQLIELKDSKSIDGGKYGALEFYDKIVANVASETKEATSKTSNYKYITDELYVLRANEIGVNEDEELLTATRYQQTFSAASKILSTLEEMFNALLQSV